MQPLKIQYELKKLGITQKMIADERGVSEMVVSKVINKQIISNPTMKLIAEKLGKQKEAVFPEYYLNPAKRTTSNVSV